MGQKIMSLCQKPENLRLVITLSYRAKNSIANKVGRALMEKSVNASIKRNWYSQQDSVAVEKSSILLQISKVFECSDGDLRCYVFSFEDLVAHLATVVLVGF